MTNMKMDCEEEEDRYHDARVALGAEKFNAVQRAKILVVGAGGIGCELLKNLVLLGVEEVVAVDLDTIDISNLNRQFLFRKKHVGMSKAVVAKGACEEFNPNAKIEAMKANVKEGRFSVAWFGGFDVVINALDNVDARRHVNRSCLAANVPLIEAGTTGYLGQVFTIVKGVTACYECFPKLKPKVYPICTIRATPDKPVHCIVWAKELLQLAFGDEKASMLFDGDDSEEDQQIEKAVFADAVAALRTTPETEADAAVALFKTELEKQMALHSESETTSTVKRVALDEATLRTAINTVEPPSVKKGTPDWDRRAWTIEESVSEFANACRNLRARQTPTSFDKDDDETMRFVAAAANLRAANFSIFPLQSLHDAKGIAGNIIPAIATTNAIVAGLQVDQLVKLIALLKIDKDLSKVRDVCKYVNCSRVPNFRGALLNPSLLELPQDNCYVCRSAVVNVGLDLQKTTLQVFVDTVLGTHFTFSEPAIDIGDSGIYDPEDSRLDDNRGLPLAEIPSITDGAMLKATDYATDLELTVVLHNRILDPDTFPEGFKIISEDETTPSDPVNGGGVNEEKNNNNKRSRDDDVPLDDNYTNGHDGGVKKLKQ